VQVAGRTVEAALAQRDAGAQWPAQWRLSQRDQVILRDGFERFTAGRGQSFGDAVAALHAATVANIIAGRTFFLGQIERAPIVGSLISGIGLVELDAGIVVVRCTTRGAPLQLGGFAL